MKIELPHSSQMIVVVYPRLSCFGCDQSEPPAYELPATFTVKLAKETWSPNQKTYEIIGRTERALLTEADATGWRMVTLYGKDLYLCPKCVETERQSPANRSVPRRLYE